MGRCKDAAQGMPDLLLIKTSSLGDVIHQMPALTDLRQHRPDIRVTWVVEEDFAPIVQLHPAVDRVMPVAWRRWRKNLGALESWRELGGFLRGLRARHYQLVIDTQGLFRSAVIAKMARGRRHGYASDSVREPPAAWMYDVRHHVRRDLHAIARNRTLTALAAGYEPEGPIDYGLRTPSGGASPPYAMLLHATAQRRKEWNEENWIALGKAVRECGLTPVFPWGSEPERQRAERIAGAVSGARVLERQALSSMARVIAGARIVVGVDTGLLHLAAAFSVPLLGLFIASDPGLTGPAGPGPIEILGKKGSAPSSDEAIAAVTRMLG